jgi:hypothetical protein
MNTRVDLQLRSDVAEYNLKFCCEDCVHYDPNVPDCSLGFRSAQHRGRALELGSFIVFCKAFELS